MGKLNIKARIKDRKTWGTVIGIAIYVLCILFLTYAFYSWRSEDTNVVIGINDSSAEVEFENDGHVNAENIGPVLSYEDGVSGGFKVTNGTGSDIPIFIKLNIISISESLLSEDFKYMIVKDVNGGTNYDYENPVVTGSFKDFEVGGFKYNLLGGDTVPTRKKYSYKVIVWIDGTVKNDIDMQNGSLTSVLYLSDYEYAYLNSVDVGSYVEYVGDNGCPEGHCDGTNANYVDDTNMGYCANSNYKYTVNGWRVGYIEEDGKVALVSAGAPECIERTASSNNATFISDANAAALEYCNEEFVDGDCSTNVDTWAIGDTDFYYMTKAINGGYGKRLTLASSSFGDVGGSTLDDTLYCVGTSALECGLGNSLIDNGGYYWFAAKNVSYNTNGVYWASSERYVRTSANTDAFGLRPVISLSESVYVVGGSGTYEDPYKIRNEKLYLSDVEVGSYVEYVGDNGCPDGHCDGTNANYVDDTDMGYCANSSYKYKVNGWRVGYVQENGRVALVSAGAPECMSRTASEGNATFISDANEAALKYCNFEFVDGDCSTNVDAWAMGDTDFYYMTKAINGGYGKRLTDGSSALGDVGGSTLGNTLYCSGREVPECGLGSSSIDNGGLYWLAASSTSLSSWGVFWKPASHSVDISTSISAYGIRPVVSLSPYVYVVGGYGTYEEPYRIANDKKASHYIIDKYNDGSVITTVNIGGDTSKPQVHLNETQGIMLDNNGDYRYYGANPNNYVSYNDELWRIISVGNVKSSATDTTGETRVKIVKADILTDDNGLNDYSYDSSASSVNSGYGVNDWSKSDLMTELNTLYFNSTSGTCYTGINNSTTACNFTNTGLSAEARNLTADALYYLGGNSTAFGVYPNDWYTIERGTTVWGTTSGQTCNDGACPRATTWIGRVGIIYPSDYAYATDLSVCKKNGYNYDTDDNCKNNDWLLNTSKHQWTISPYSSNAIFAFRVISSGSVRHDDRSVRYADGVRAVQYLRSEVTIVEGEGTSTNPYKLGT